MTQLKFAAICSNGHIVDYKRTHDALVSQSGCQNCGKTVHTVCPNCGNQTVLVQEEKQENGQNQYHLDDYCRECNEAFPWGPGKVGQFLDDKGISFNPSSAPSPRKTILTHEIREQLSQSKYGSEVIKQITDGDKCYENRLWQPALSTYIHGLEWAIITYLDEEKDIDVIEKERDGTYYNLAGRSPNLLDEITDHVAINQKTINRIEDLNRAERRWMAHHKSGEVLREEVESVRSRLGVLLTRLFDEKAR